MKPYYVTLTGSKNNAGDFLIKHRAQALFAALRPDRAIVDFDGWLPLDEKQLRIVNGATALILLGGPALQRNMYPDIYGLTPALAAIVPPIVSMGIGWKSPRGDWRDTHDYPLSRGTRDLLDVMAASGLRSSVRDFHTLNALARHGYRNFAMTGCPAYYELDALGREPAAWDASGKVAFSLGVTFVRSASMESAMKAQILRLRDTFSDRPFEVVFHHSLEPSAYLSVHGASRKHNDRHNRFAAWLDANGIGHVDISGSAERMISYYQDVALHIGYRVHAHIFMNSLSRPSVLFAEDGRGKATRDVIGGMVVDGFDRLVDGRLARVVAGVVPGFDRYTANNAALEDALAMIRYEAESGMQRSRQSRAMIDQNFSLMQSFLAQLP